MNAINERVIEELTSAIDIVERAANVRTLVIAGSGKAFSAGGDFSTDENSLELTNQAAAPFYQGYRRFIAPLICKMQGLQVPTIAMVNGAAIGFGFDLTLACDIRVGSEHSKFQVAWVKLGLIPAAGSSWLLPRLVGVGRAAELIFSGRVLGAEEAEQIGVLNKLVPPSELKNETMQLALSIAQNPPVAIRLAKLTFYKGLESNLPAALELLGACQTIALSTKDHKEALAAFRQKRKATFEGE